MLHTALLLTVSILAVLVASMPAAAQWMESDKLTAPHPVADDLFGYSVAISGTTAIVGAHPYRSDSVYLFDVTTGSQLRKLISTTAASAGGDWFGCTVAISGNTAIVGAPRDAQIYDDLGNLVGVEPAAAYLFDVTTGSLLHKLTASATAADDFFGRTVAISSNTAIVAAWYSDEPGSAYLFDITTGDQLYKLTSPDAAATDRFARSVAISGNIAIVGALGDDDAGTDAGAAYLFDVTTGTQLQELTASDTAAGDYFGCSVAISGNIAIVGANCNDGGSGDNSGSAYVFDVTTGTQLRKLISSDLTESDVFGSSVAISGNIAIVGANGDDDGGSISGSAYLFDVTTGNQLNKLTASDAVKHAWFGHSVGISGSTAIVGEWRHLDAAGSSGSAYLFTRPLTWDNQGGTGNYDWGVAANWDPDDVPTDAVHAIIANGNTVLLNAVYEANIVSVEDGGLLVTSDGQLTVGVDTIVAADGTLQVNGTLTTGQLDSGGELVIAPGGQLSATEGVRIAPGSTSWVNGTWDATDPTLWVNGTLNTANANCDGTLWLSGMLNASQVTVQGAMNVMPNGQVIATANVAIQAGSTLDVDGSVTAASVHCGGTLSGGGTIAAPVTVADGGIVSPGDGVDVLTTDNIVFQDGASLEIKLAGTTPDNECDQLDVTGELDLSSTRDFLILKWLPSGSESKFGGKYVVAPYGTRISIFDSVGGGSDPYSIGQRYVKGVDYFSGRVSVLLHPLLDGDTDLDGKVGLSDWDTFRNNFGRSETDWTHGNFDPWDNSVVDLNDWDAFRNNFGRTVPAASAAMNVPEPAALVMLLGAGLLGLGVLGCRRKTA